MLANKRKAGSVRIKASKRITQQMQKRQPVPIKSSKTSGRTRKINSIYCQFIQSRPKPTKTKATKNSSIAGPLTQTVTYDLSSYDAQMSYIYGLIQKMMAMMKEQNMKAIINLMMMMVMIEIMACSELQEFLGQCSHYKTINAMCTSNA